MFLYLLMGLEAAENLAAKPLCEISKDRQHVIRSDAETSSLEWNVPHPCWRETSRVQIITQLWL